MVSNRQEFQTSIEKAFAITAAFEGGGYSTLTGNFDGQGLSYGFLCFNLGSGTLQPLLASMHMADPAEFRRCCTQKVDSPPFNGKMVDLTTDVLALAALDKKRAVSWAIARQDAGHRLLPHWTRLFKALAAVPAFQAVQRRFAGGYMATAKKYMAAYGFKSERALALLFDIAVQMGSISAMSRARYIAATVGRTLAEPAKLEALARAVAPQGGKWAADVLSRKLTIAKGAGIVHGRPYNLANDYGLGDGPVTA